LEYIFVLYFKRLFMWRKTYIRFMFFVMIIAGALMVTSASRSANKTTNTECSDSKEQCCEKRNQGEFIIWESLSRTIMATVQD
jgi:hypothetical protein